MSKIQNHEYVSPEAKKLLAAYAKAHGIPIEDAEAWALDCGIRRLAALNRAEARRTGAESWAGKSDARRAAPGRKAKPGAHKGLTEKDAQ